MTGRVVDLQGRRLTLELDKDFRSQYNALTGYKVDIEIKRHYPGRSPSANAYAWTLMRQIASKTGEDVDELYRRYLRQHGAKMDVKQVRIENFADDVEAFVKGHTGRYVSYTDKGDGTLEVFFHYGSSDFDSKQFGEFLDSIIEDCRLLRIPTGDKPNL